MEPGKGPAGRRPKEPGKLFPEEHMGSPNSSSERREARAEQASGGVCHRSHVQPPDRTVSEHKPPSPRSP